MRLVLEGLTIKAALALGFSLTLGIWVFTGYYSAQRISAVEREAEAIGARYMRAQELLSQIGAQLLLSSVYVRDALLDRDPAAIGRHRQRLEETYDALDRALDDYIPVIHSDEERAQVARLQSEIDDFRATARAVLAGDAARSASDALQVLNTQVVPKRQSAIRLSEDVRALNRTALMQQQSSVAELHRVAERRSWQWLSVAFGLSLGIGLLATTYSSRLETSLRRQRAVEAQNSRYLQELSARLITTQEEERRTIARELHDEVGQVLTAIKVELAVAERRLDASGGAGELLSDAQAIADTALRSVRDISHLLHPALLDDLGLVAAVDWYLQSVARRHGLAAELVQNIGKSRLDPHVELAAYRIVQEATANVIRHAAARTCLVTLEADAARLTVSIEDDGQGFDPAAPRGTEGRRGLGLISMRERALLLGGSVRVDSTPGRGTRVAAILPIDNREEIDG